MVYRLRGLGLCVVLVAAAQAVGLPAAHACETVDDCVAAAAYPGALPGVSNPAALTVDTTKAQGKLTLMLKDSLVLDQLLAGNLQAPVPPESSVAEYTTPPPESNAPPSSGKVSITGMYQGAGKPWCIPAATSTALTAFGVNVAVSTLAAEQDANDGATLDEVVVSANRRESRNYYMVVDSTSSTGLVSYVASDIYRRRAPVVIGALTSGLYWWEKTDPGLHALTIYLYHTSGGGGFSVYDSGYNARHSIKAADLWAASKANDGLIAW